MKHTLLYIVALAVLPLLGSCQDDDLVTTVPRDDASMMPSAQQQQVVKGQMYVKFREMKEDLQVAATRSGGVSTSNSELDAAVSGIGVKHIRRLFPEAGKFEARTRAAGLHLWYLVEFDETVEVGKAMDAVMKVDNVAHVESIPVPVPDATAEEFVPPTDYTVNDPYFYQQWHLYNWGADYMPAGYDIDAISAWKNLEESEQVTDVDVVVAIIDSAVDTGHEDLSRSMWYDFTDFDNFFGLGVGQQTTPDKHGTHVAGILAAQCNNGKGVCGVAGLSKARVKIMSCLFNRAVESIKYAADHGAVICTNSYHTGTDDNTRKAYQEAIDYFVQYAGVDENGNQTGPMRGGIIFASAGNDNENPARYTPGSLENVIAVGSVGPTFKKSSFSNYADWVDIVAPGGEDGYGWQIYSTLPSVDYVGQYGEAAGTSMSTPVVAGVAALIVAKFGGTQSGLTPDEVEARLLLGAENIDAQNPAYIGKLGAGCVNANNSLSLNSGALNLYPTIVADRDLYEQQILYYGEKAEFSFTIKDKETPADELVGSLEDPTGCATIRHEGNKLYVTIENKNSEKAGNHIIGVVVTDKKPENADEAEVNSRKTTISVKLLPEPKKEVEIPSTVTDKLTIHASMTFSGNVTARLYDATGNLALERRISISLSQPGVIDLTGLNGGTYTLKLTCNNQTITKNIIKL